MTKGYGKYLTPLMIIVDIFLVNAIFAGCYYITTPYIYFYGKLRLLFVSVNLSFIPAYLIFYHAQSKRTLTTERLIWASIKGISISFLFVALIAAFIPIWDIPVWFYLLLFGSYYILFPVGWHILNRTIKALRRRGINIRQVVIIGTDSNAQRLVSNLRADTGYGIKLLGYFSNTPPSDPSMNVIGTTDELEKFCKENSVDEIYYTLPGHNESRVKDVIRVAENNMARFYFVPEISSYIKGNFHLESINSSVPALSLHPSPLQNPFNRAAKRIFDVIFSGVVLSVLFPLVFIPVGIIIKFSSPGPIFFRQRRTGYRGNEFTCYKFRTMKVNADSDSRQASKDDDRKTRVGEFLRKTSIDELPQFFNVLKGDMSVVGPRPHMLLHTEIYRQLIDKYMVRHLVKPGITGWAQVNGYRGNTDQLWKMEKRVDFDVWYIEHWNFMLDIRIIYRTIANAVHGEENAY